MIAALSSWHVDHDAASRALVGVTALPVHVVLEAYAVLTRLPGGLAVPQEDAAAALRRRFDGPPLGLPDAQRGLLAETLARAGVYGGASYDGLVGLEAHAHGRVLYSLDRRAQETYRRLNVSFTAV